MRSSRSCRTLVRAERHQDDWAALPDASDGDISTSLALLHSLHARWVAFFTQLPDDAWARTGFHPQNSTVTLESQLHTYAAHGLGHIDQITKTLAVQ